ncbi:hypothetical protein ACRC6Q_01675 [Planococcus sp. SE5232]|uniref:hypothetical protein n=1 Tax=unclassified Planococcus (in: firmicutes) TaxID=2662419 RepID=UPI001CC1AFB1|nr:hypothetical protein [Planococcus sp. 4-30]
MDALILIGFFISMALVVLMLKKLEKKYGVDRAEAGEPLKKIERSAGWISGISLIGLIGLATAGVAINYMIVLLCFGGLAVLQTLIEWKYVGNSRRSLVSLLLTIVFILSILGLMGLAEWTAVDL